MATVGAETLESVAATPSQTILPSTFMDTAQRALDVLRGLSGASPTASLQLTPGPVLGQGGMGVVRCAEQVSLGRTVAIKTLRPERRKDPAAALDLLREAWVTGSIEHPNVVPVHYLGVEPDGTPLIVLKRITGVEWSKLVRDPDAVAARFGATDLLAWNLGNLLQVLNALRFAHHHGVIHRDLKPANVMIGDFGEVYLLDWGIACALRDDGTGRLPLAVHQTQLAGTPAYMAPEMLGREEGPPLSERTDVYLAGAVLFELVVGAPPHRGSSALEVLTSVFTSKPVVPPAVPHELARIITTAMAEDPAQRFESAEAMRLALQQYLEHRGSSELCERAQERTDQLLAAIAEREDPAATGAVHDEIYRLFGACRFGFHEALAVWPDNAEAKAGFARAAIAMAEFELACGAPEQALALLADFDAPAELVAKVQAAAAAKAKRAAELEDIGSRYDEQIGLRTRWFLVTVVSLVYTIVPIVFQLLHLHITPDRFLIFAASGVFVISGFLYWARDTMTATDFNRRAAIAALYSFIAQLVSASGIAIAGGSVAEMGLITIFSWFAFAAMLAISFSRSFAVAVVGYLAAFFVDAVWPQSFLWAIAGGNLLLSLSASISWRPPSFDPSDEDRARLEAAKRRRDARASQPRLDAGRAQPSTDGSDSRRA